MEIKDIEYVKAIKEHGSLTKAAESLFISQPSLSLYLKNMQDRLGFKVFDQIGRKFELTYIGGLFLETGIEILRIREDFYDHVSYIINNEVGRLRVALPIIRGSYFAPAILPKFKKVYPNIKIELIEGSSNLIEEKIKNGEADIALMNRPNHPIDAEIDLIKSEEILLAVPYHHPLNSKLNNKIIEDLSMFKDEQFIIHHPDQRTGQISKSIFEQYNFFPENILYTRNIETALNLTKENFGVTFVNESHTKHLQLIHPPLYYSLLNPFYTDLIAVFRKDRILPPYGKFFIDLCREVM